jgi:uncharacterized membrane protein YkvA (DUF1232 family)
VEEVLFFSATGLVALYVLTVLALVVFGRRTDARALAGFIPDCLILMRRLLADKRVPRHNKLMLGFVLAYLAMPFDLIPDFVPVAGQLDDALIVALALRALIRATGADVIREHWPGPDRSLRLIVPPRRRELASP